MIGDERRLNHEAEAMRGGSEHTMKQPSLESYRRRHTKAWMIADRKEQSIEKKEQCAKGRGENEKTKLRKGDRGQDEGEQKAKGREDRREE